MRSGPCANKRAETSAIERHHQRAFPQFKAGEVALARGRLVRPTQSARVDPGTQRHAFGITVVCIKPKGQAFTYATADTKVGPEDILVVAGETGHAEAFAELG
jgi:Trk K+ transport system NAD-binding subunit